MAFSETSFGAAFRLTLLTNDPDWARAADDAGVNRVGVDIERLGKAERQPARLGARLSTHTLDDLRVLAPHVTRARLFCRLDPPHEGTRQQVDRAIGAGATCLMLPYFQTVDQAAAFVAAVGGRAETLLLVETTAAADAIGALASLDGVDEIMVGLNDLGWSLGAASRFAILSHPILRVIADAVGEGGKRFSVGGLGRWDDASLPTPPDLLYAQYPRLGATGAWLSRSFLAGLTTGTLGAAVQAARARLDHWATQPRDAWQSARAALERQSGTVPPQPR